MKIMIDAGHYSYYNQSNVYKRYYEGNMTWTLCEYLKEELEKYGFTVDTTRKSRDKDLDLYSRGYKAKGYDLFISLHSNACDSESVDRVVIIKGFDQDNILAEKLAYAIQSVMPINQKYQIYTKRKSNGDCWYGVLRGARAAKVDNRFIIEHGFHTNTNTAKWLFDNDNLKLLAKVEADAIAEYYGVKPKIEDRKGYNCLARVICKDTLNVRDNRPYTDGELGDIIDTLSNKDIVILGYVYNGWGSIYYNGKIGFVNVKYLEVI